MNEKKNKTRARVFDLNFLAWLARFDSTRLDLKCALRVRSYRRFATHWTLQTCPSQQTSLTQRRDATLRDAMWAEEEAVAAARQVRTRNRERERENLLRLWAKRAESKRESEQACERAKPVCQMPQDATVVTVCQSVSQSSWLAKAASSGLSNQRKLPNYG